MLAAIKEYEASKWKVIGQKVGKPAKVSKSTYCSLIETDDTRHASNMPKSILAVKFDPAIMSHPLAFRLQYLVVQFSIAGETGQAVTFVGQIFSLRSNTSA